MIDYVVVEINISKYDILYRVPDTIIIMESMFMFSKINIIITVWVANGPTPN